MSGCLELLLVLKELEACGQVGLGSEKSHFTNSSQLLQAREDGDHSSRCKKLSEKHPKDQSCCARLM